MDKLRSFYKNKKIFITGHTGFKGTWLVNTLLNFGAKVYGYSLKDKNKKNYESICDYKKVKNIYGDVLNYRKLYFAIKKINPEIIFHLAAQSLVSESYIQPKFTIETNLNGTINILEIIRLAKKLKAAVIITSDKCYQNYELKKGYKETDRLGGDDIYSASKASVEILFKAYLKSKLINTKKIGIATARAGNVIGGGDWSKNRIIPDIVKSVLEKKNLFVRNPDSTRPWQHVLEPISGYLLLAKKLSENPNLFSSSYNFGPNVSQTLSVNNVVQIFLKNLGVKKRIIKNSGIFKESKLLKLNSSKAKKKLSWKNTWGMKKSINETALWYKVFINNKLSIKNFSKRQISNYFYD